MKQRLLFLLAVSFFITCLAGCLKKGEDDPLVSFRTRKARIVGKWKMVRGSKLQTDNVYTIKTTFTSDHFEEVRSSYIGTFSESGDAKFTLEFDKNGHVNMQQKLDGSSAYGLVGTWNFTGNVGNKKNKEQIVLQEERMSYLPNIIYQIKELRNKKLVLYRKYAYVSYNYEENFEFEPQ